ncbi:MAG TPA: glycosyltransferase family 4 protein [Bryobacteraceae bacterium]|nr:glycosyltransferase family 4 protein [Bryobacteraceae bacterium]
MRVLITTFHRNVIGGTEKYLQALIPGLSGRGHQIGLLYEKPFDSQLESITPAVGSAANFCLADAGEAGALRSVAEWKPDVVYNQGLQAGDLEGSLLESYPTVLFAHGYYGTCATGSKCFAFPRHEACSRRFGPACLLMHYPRRCGGLNPVTAWGIYRMQLKRNSHLGSYETVLVASNHMREEFVRHGVSADRIQIAPLPLAHHESEILPPYGKAHGYRILLMGRLTSEKGGRHLIQAVKRASKELGQSVTLTVAGDGPERARLENEARDARIAAEFVGWIDAGRKAELLAETDLLAVPSLWPEPFGLVGIEAGAWGVPAVGYAVGGIPDWLIPGQTGELAPGDPPSVSGLADAIVRALKDPQHYAELQSGARQMARRFTLDRHLNILEPALASAAALTHSCRP